MTTLLPPTTAWSKSRGTDALLDTRMPAYLQRRGYRASWPAGAVVFDVEGVPSDETVPDGTFLALNVEEDENGVPRNTLYRRTNDGWRSVNGEI